MVNIDLSRKLKYGICMILLYFMSYVPVVAAELIASVDRNPVMLNESFIFKLIARGSVRGKPDFSLLEKDFQILRQTMGSNMSYINGAVSHEKTWTLVLMSKKSGTLIIPPIPVGADKSQTFNLTVVKSKTNNNANSGQNRNLYMEISISAKTVYVQQELLVNLKIFRAVRITNAQLSELEINVGEALINKSDNLNEYEELINGRRYIVIEQQYALFPQKSGDLTISPITFTTEIVKQRQSIFSFDPFNQNNEVKRMQTQAVTIKVKAIPKSFSKAYPVSQWLPVRHLQLDETWSADANTLKAGEPVTQTITINADGISGNLLPDITMKIPNSIKTYPDKAVTSDQLNKIGLLGSKQFKIALLPTKVGRYQIPAYSMVWWNTKKNKLETAHLPARSINVIPGTENVSKPAITQTPTIVNSEQNKIKSELKITNDIVANPLWVILSGLFAVAWLVTLFILMRTRRNFFTRSIKSVTKNKKITISTTKIKKACLNNDAAASCAALLEWANSETNSKKFTNIATLYPHASDKLFLALKELEAVLYQPINRKRKWLGETLWQLFNKETPTIQTKNKPVVDTGRLAPLYPKTSI